MTNAKAVAAKELGNSAFKSGDYPTAIGHYTTAIVQDRQEPTYYLNRAAAYLKLGKFVDAENDSTKVLALEDKNVKALFRRGQARSGLGKLVEARQDLEAAEKLQPTDIGVKAELERVVAKIDATKPKPAIKEVTPAQPPPRRRVPIRIVDGSSSSPVVSPPAAPLKSALKSSKLPDSAPGPAGEPGMLRAVSTRSLSSKNVDAAGPSTTPPPAPSFKEAKEARENFRPSRVGGGIFRPSGQNTIFKTRGGDDDAPTTESAPARAIKAPENLFELSRAWHSASTEERYDIIASIPLDRYGTMFQSSLEPELLASICSVFLERLEQSKTAAVIDSMNALAQVPRFGTLLLFFSDKEKEIVADLVARLGRDAVDSRWL